MIRLLLNKTTKRLANTFLADTGSLTAKVTEVVEARAAYAAPGHNLDFLKTGRVDGKGLFHANTVGDFAYGNAGADGAALTTDNNALENLNPFLGALNDADMNLYGIARTKIRHIVAHIFFFDHVNYVHSDSLFKPMFVEIIEGFNIYCVVTY